MEPVLIYVTAANRAEAEKIARVLLEERLIACSNLVDHVQSCFWWQENLDRASEVLCIFKSLRKNFSAINKRIKELHSYETPCVVALPIIDGNPDFLEWISASCG
ncbi:MAG: divalent-cation tolerance protein CutA [Deltaproteobacteria bacterium]|jgi:periplasmic divalent cation tolerance protein|nr:divalent-cation tolerance protein CutA [Deltaproteobacteria bacterium]